MGRRLELTFPMRVRFLFAIYLEPVEAALSCLSEMLPWFWLVGIMQLAFVHTPLSL